MILCFLCYEGNECGMTYGEKLGVMKELRNGPPIEICIGTDKILLCPVNNNWRSVFDNLPEKCGRWRKLNPTVANSSFKITKDRTISWLDFNISACETTLLFIIKNEMLGEIGHIGFDLMEDSSIWISRVVRGEKGVPGAMSEAVREICSIAFSKFDCDEIFLECYEDNIRGVNFYQENGFSIIGKKFLLPKQLNDEVTWAECSEKDDYKRVMLVLLKTKR